MNVMLSWPFVPESITTIMKNKAGLLCQGKCFAWCGSFFLFA